MKRMIRSLSDRRGAVLVQAAAAVLSMMIVFSLAYQYGRVLLISSGVKNEIKNAAITAITDNYYPSFNGMREGNSGAYALSGGSFKSTLNEGNIKQYLCINHQLTASGSVLQKNEDDGSLQFSISDINVSYKNGSLASNKDKLKTTVFYTINIPVKFFVGNPLTFSFPESAEVEFEQKF